MTLPCARPHAGRTCEGCGQPQRPPDSITCPRCQGHQWLCIAGSRTPTRCPTCSGRGYLLAVEAMESDEERELYALRARVRELENQVRELGGTP